MRRIHDHLDNSFESILQDGGLNVWKKWAKLLLDKKEMQPGSVRSYLLSLSKFCEFVVDHLVHQVSGFPQISDIFNRTKSVSLRFKNMSSLINKEYAHLKWEKRMQEEANAVPVSVIQEMMDTKSAVEAICYLTLSYNSHPTEKMFLAIRDLLLARLEIENCQRPGPLESATLEEFNQAKKVDGKIVMNVARHKTLKVGPVPITMSKNTFTNLKACDWQVRPHFATKEEEALFVTHKGNAFPSGSIGRKISAWWKRTTGQDITSTQLRKVGSTETMDEDLQTQIAVQTLMTHQRTTAEDHYQILNKTRQAVKGHAARAKKLGLKETEPTVFKEDSQSQEEPSEFQSPSKSGFTEDQLNDINILFAEKITTNAPLTMLEVRNIMLESINLVTEQSLVKRVYKHVNYLQKKNFQHGLDQINDENNQFSNNWVTSVSSAFSGPSQHFTWSKPHTDVIAEAFKTYDKCPLKDI